MVEISDLSGFQRLVLICISQLEDDAIHDNMLKWLATEMKREEDDTELLGTMLRTLEILAEMKLISFHDESVFRLSHEADKMLRMSDFWYKRRSVH